MGGLVGLTLGKSLANTENDREPLVESYTGLLGDEIGGLVEDGTTLRVAEDNVGDACVDELSRAVEVRRRKYQSVLVYTREDKGRRT